MSRRSGKHAAEKLAERQKAFDRLKQEVQRSRKRPGSLNNKKKV